MAGIWLGALLLFLILEGQTAAVVALWFAAGALVAMIAAACGAQLWLQVVLFLLVSAAALALTRPLLRKITSTKAEATNADRVLGEVAKVTETIDNQNSAGAVYIDGKSWTARSVDDTVIPAGSQVQIESMQGVKLLVKRVEKKVEV